MPALMTLMPACERTLCASIDRFWFEAHTTQKSGRDRSRGGGDGGAGVGGLESEEPGGLGYTGVEGAEGVLGGTGAGAAALLAAAAARRAKRGSWGATLRPGTEAVGAASTACPT